MNLSICTSSQSSSDLGLAGAGTVSASTSAGSSGARARFTAALPQWFANHTSHISEDDLYVPNPLSLPGITRKDGWVLPLLYYRHGLVLDRLDSDRNGKIDKAELENRRRRRMQKRDFFLRTRNISYEACHGPDEGTQAHGDAQVLKLRGAPDAPPKGSMPASGAGGRAPRGGKKQAAVTF